MAVCRFVFPKNRRQTSASASLTTEGWRLKTGHETTPPALHYCYFKPIKINTIMQKHSCEGGSGNNDNNFTGREKNYYQASRQEWRLARTVAIVAFLLFPSPLVGCVRESWGHWGKVTPRSSSVSTRPAASEREEYPPYAPRPTRKRKPDKRPLIK